jgi:hypothetical protein
MRAAICSGRVLRLDICMARLYRKIPMHAEFVAAIRGAKTFLVLPSPNFF